MGVRELRHVTIEAFIGFGAGAGYEVCKVWFLCVK